MKPYRALTLRAFHRNPRSRRGVALLLVLGCLVLLTALILGLIISSQNNLKSSKLYANGSSVKTLADSTVSLVMAQINQATSNGTQVAWASQPGMIRTYDNKGNPLTNYRLFSWDAPTVSGTYTASNDALQLSSSASTAWYNSPAVFVDLNQPVADTKGTLHYPIIDGNPGDLTTYTTPAPASTSVLTYTPYTGTFNGVVGPIPQIEGFWVIPPNTAAAAASSSSPAISAGPAINSKTTSPSNSSNNDIPMPVKWLYVLKDGTVAAPASTSTGTTVTINAASTTNPIVGRIAYWTDDETSKVNINTASEGSFSDTPRTNGASDFDFAAYPTAQNEVQRYPGHPAMTSLSTVFGSFFPVDHSLPPPSNGSYYTAPSPSETYPPYQPYYDLAPKLNVDTGTNLGSKAGTVLAYNGQAGTGTPTALINKTDRLYSTVDELMFSSNLFTDNAHTASTTVTGASGTRPLSTSGTFTQAFLEKAKFFLTADSRAPDVNLFNQPRILTWPISSTNDAAHRTPFDQAIAFCGTLNNLPFYFQRSRSDLPTFDLDDATMARNRQLLKYLQVLTSTSVPGFGGNFLTKYPQAKTSFTNTGLPPSDRDQILTEIFDYIRCLNLNDQSTAAMTNPFAPIATSTLTYTTTGKYALTTGSGATSTVAGHAGLGCVVPIYDTVTNTRGFGRFPTISEISIMFIATGWNDGQDVATNFSGSATGTNDVNYINPTAGVNPRGYAYQSYYTNSASAKISAVPWGFYNDGTDTMTPVFNGYSTTGPAWYAPPFTTQTTSTGGVQVPPVTAGTIQVQAALLINFFDPSQGNLVESPTARVQILGLNNFQWGSTSGSVTPMGFPDAGASTATNTTSNMYPMDSNVPEYTENWGGNLGFRAFLVGQQAGQTQGAANSYPFVSWAKNFPYVPDKTAANGGGGQFYFSGGDITINLLIPSQTVGYPPASWPTTLSNPQKTTQPPIQQIKVTFPSATLPLPTMATPGFNNVSSNKAFTAPPHVYQGTYSDRGYWNDRFEIGDNTQGINTEFITATDVVRSVRAAPGDMRMIAGQPVIIDTASSAAAGAGYFDSTGTKVLNEGLSAWQYTGTANLVHSLRESIDYPFGGATLGQLVPGLGYAGVPAPGTYFSTQYNNGLATYSSGGNSAGANGALMWNYNGGNPVITTIPGDWDNGMSYTADGPYINKPDEGDYNFSNISGNGSFPYYAEINAATTSTFTPGYTFFSPNRLMSGPGMFGSLPTGVARNLPWQTLLFCPNPPAGPVHPGFGVGSGTLGPTDIPPYTTPPDHLLMDLFNMPVVEPYPISEPLSTAGRINMNYQIVPFTYIERSTGLRAVLKSERMTVIPDSTASSYKQANSTGASNTTNYDFRVPINADQTLYGFDSFFASSNDIFRSASQICDMFLYPARDALMSLTAGPLWDAANVNITKFWNGNTVGGSYTTGTVTPSNTSWPTHYLTGDNSREKPYADIYPRLTTKSNTFTIHYYVQTLQKIVNSNPTLWNDATDKVTGEYRGSTTVERYVNPNDTTLPDFAAQAIAGTPVALDSYYKFRVVNERQFAP